MWENSNVRVARGITGGITSDVYYAITSYASRWTHTTDAFTAFLTRGYAHAFSECSIVIRNSHSLKKRDGKIRRKRMNNN